MKIGVFSDSHGKTANLKNISEKFDYVLHLGDFADDIRNIADYFSCPYSCVRGNCDMYDTQYPKETIVTFENVRLLLTHGHKLRSEMELGLLGEETNCNAVLFGHTHTPFLSSFGKILLINPGSFSEPRYGSKASYSILTIDNGELYVKMCPLHN